MISAAELPKGTTSVTAADFRVGLTKHIGQVRHAGARIIVTTHGAPACALVPIEDLRQLRRLQLAVGRAKRSKDKMIPLDGPLFEVD